MRNIYEAQSAVVAPMVADLLKGAGIEATVTGDRLQGAAGELSASGLNRVMVDASDVDAAREIIEEIEASAEPSAPNPGHNGRLPTRTQKWPTA